VVEKDMSIRNVIFAKNYEEVHEILEADEDSMLQKINVLHVEHIGHMRAFTSSLLTIAIAVVAAALTFLGGSSPHVYQYPLLALIGIGCLILDAIGLIAYSSYVLIKENVDLTERRDFIESSFKNSRVLATQVENNNGNIQNYISKFREQGKEYSLVEQGLVKKSKHKAASAKWLYLFSALFCFGILFFMLSLNPLWRLIARL
jgi:hypothetical protein